MTTPARTTPDQLPDAVRGYLAAHAARDAEAALRAFSPSAVVLDDGTTYRGTEELRRFVAEAGAEFSYTTTVLDTERLDDTSWVVTQRLEGDFPGGVVDLRFRFEMDGDLVGELVIAP